MTVQHYDESLNPRAKELVDMADAEAVKVLMFHADESPVMSPPQAATAWLAMYAAMLEDRLVQLGQVRPNPRTGPD